MGFILSGKREEEKFGSWYCNWNFVQKVHLAGRDFSFSFSAQKDVPVSNLCWLVKVVFWESGESGELALVGKTLILVKSGESKGWNEERDRASGLIFLY